MAMYTTDAPQIIEHVSKSLSFTPFDCKWVPSSARFVALGSNPRNTGAIHLFELAPEETKLTHQIETPYALKCGTFGASMLEERHLATGTHNGKLQIWDIDRASKGSGIGSASSSSGAGSVVGGAGAGSSGTVTSSLAASAAVFSADAHKSMLNCIDGCGGLGIGGGAPELVTGGHDGCVRVWDPRVPDPVVSLEPAAGETARDCWSVAFGNSFDEERCVAACYDNGDVKLFDLRTQTMRWETNVGNGVVSLEFDRKDIAMNKLVATMLEGKFRVFDMRTRHPVEGYAHTTERAHKATVWMAKHVPQNRDLFMTTGGNGGLNVYKYHYPDKRAEKDSEGHMRGIMGRLELLNARIVSSQPIVGFDWHPDKEGLACAVSLDQQVRVLIVTKLEKY